MIQSIGFTCFLSVCLEPLNELGFSGVFGAKGRTIAFPLSCLMVANRNCPAASLLSCSNHGWVCYIIPKWLVPLQHYLVHETEQCRKTSSFQDKFKEDEVINFSLFLVKHLLEISVFYFSMILTSVKISFITPKMCWSLMLHLQLSQLTCYWDLLCKRKGERWLWHTVLWEEEGTYGSWYVLLTYFEAQFLNLSQTEK